MIRIDTLSLGCYCLCPRYDADHLPRGAKWLRWLSRELITTRLFFRMAPSWSRAAARIPMPADIAHAVLPAELWSPATQTWTTLASMSAPRLYHSEALLLPDGRVMISGGGRFNDDHDEPTDQLSARILRATIPLQRIKTDYHFCSSAAVVRTEFHRANAERRANRQSLTDSLWQRDTRYQYGPALSPVVVYGRKRLANRHSPGEFEPRASGQLHAIHR